MPDVRNERPGMKQRGGQWDTPGVRGKGHDCKGREFRAIQGDGATVATTQGRTQVQIVQGKGKSRSRLFFHLHRTVRATLGPKIISIIAGKQGQSQQIHRQYAGQGFHGAQRYIFSFLGSKARKSSGSAPVSFNRKLNAAAYPQRGISLLTKLLPAGRLPKKLPFL